MRHIINSNNTAHCVITIKDTKVTNKTLKRKLRKLSKLYMWEQITRRYMQDRMIMRSTGRKIKINR
jgi:hypothetical protein